MKPDLKKEILKDLALHEAAKRVDLDEIIRLMDTECASANALFGVDNHNNALKALIGAYSDDDAGKVECLKAMLTRGADPNLDLGRESTPAIEALCCGEFALFEVLKNAGADVDEEIEAFWRRFHALSPEGMHQEIIRSAREAAKAMPGGDRTPEPWRPDYDIKKILRQNPEPEDAIESFCELFEAKSGAVMGPLEESLYWLWRLELLVLDGGLEAAISVYGTKPIFLVADHCPNKLAPWKEVYLAAARALREAGFPPETDQEDVELEFPSSLQDELNRIDAHYYGIDDTLEIALVKWLQQHGSRLENTQSASS